MPAGGRGALRPRGGSCGAAEVVLFGEAHEREPGVKERRLLPPPRPAEPPSPRPAAAGEDAGGGLRGRDPGRLAPRRPHAHRAVHDLHGWGLAPERVNNIFTHPLVL